MDDFSVAFNKRVMFCPVTALNMVQKMVQINEINERDHVFMLPDHTSLTYISSIFRAIKESFAGR